MNAVSTGIIQRKGKFLIGQRRATDKRYPLKWDFPGGKLEKGEDYLDALVRELKEEVDIDVDPFGVKFVWSGFHPEFYAFITFYLITYFDGVPYPKEYMELRWETKEEILERDDLINDLMKHILMTHF